MKTKHLKNISKIFLATSLLSTSLFSNDQILLENAWVNVGFSNAKDTMVSGATTATGKGFSSLFTNPAGLATNYAAGLYISSTTLEHKNATGSGNKKNALATIFEIKPADVMAVGIFYKSLVIEMKPNIHNAVGIAYGLETSYGLFSLGANYVMDETSVSNSSDADAIDYNRRFATGDYYTVGAQWQKSFVGIDDFYALYFGYSQKGQGVSIIPGEQIGRVSPLVTRIGVGVETNMFASTVLLSIDQISQSWSHINDTYDTTAIGLKWMMFDGFALALGTSTSTYSTEVDLKSSSTMSFGLEFAAWKTNVAIAALQKEVLNNAGDVYIQENSVHADISFAF